MLGAGAGLGRAVRSIVPGVKFAAFFRWGALLFVALGLMDQLDLFGRATSSVPLVYYTTQSNVLALVLFLALAVRTTLGLRDGGHGGAGFFARFEMVCVVNLLVTLVVFWVYVAPGASGLWTFRNLAVHLVTPLLCLVDYLMFARVPHLKYRDVYLSCVFPLAYLVFVVVAAFAGYTYGYRTDQTGSLVAIHYPYGFLDVDQNGASTVVYSLAVLAFLVLVSHVFFVIDAKVRQSAGSLTV